MFHKKEWFILITAIVASILLLPTLNKKPSFKYWVGVFLLNGIVNVAIDKYLVAHRYLSYPVRVMPKFTKINLVYDLLVCPYISVWYCQKTFNSKLKGIIGKCFYFAIPQILFEIWAEKTTDLLEYKRLNFFNVSALIFSVKFSGQLISRFYSKILMADALSFMK